MMTTFLIRLQQPCVLQSLQGMRPLSTTMTDCARKWKYNPDRDLHPVEVPTNTELPERYRLNVMTKTPSMYVGGGVRPYKGTKELWRMMGEDKAQSDLVLGQFGVVALTGGMLKHRHFEMIRATAGRNLNAKKTFAIYRVDAPYKPITDHGFGKRMGGGKGGIDEYGTPVRAGRVIMEVGGKAEWMEVQPWLQVIAGKLPFKALAVSAEYLKKLREEEERLTKANQNPITFEWLIRNNIMNCQLKFSEYDRRWFGRFTYKDRKQNMKWQSVTKMGYPEGKN